jgi:dolichyl-phosphate-mannose--protein O-mannosyl transferase
MAIALLFKRNISLATRPSRAKNWVWVYLWLAAAVSIFFIPVWWGVKIPLWFWRAHMWLPSWI